MDLHLNIVEEETYPNPKDDKYLASLISTVEQDLLAADTVYTNTSELRQQVTSKLFAAVSKMDLDITDKTDPELQDTKLRSVEVLLKSLSDQEKNAMGRVNAKMKKRELESSANFTVDVLQLVTDLNNQNTETIEQLQTNNNLMAERLLQEAGIELNSGEVMESNDVSDIAGEIRDEMLSGQKSEL